MLLLGKVVLPIVLIICPCLEARAQPLEPAADKASADIFLAGALTSASNAETIYAWDVKLTYPKLMREIRESEHWFQFSPRLEFTANKGTDANLDRLVTAAHAEIDFFTFRVLGRHIPNVVWVNIAGAEFDRDLLTKAFTYHNFVRLAFRTFGRPGRVDAQGVEGPPVAFLPRVEVGFETGANRQNRLQAGGSGAVARLYFGATAFQDFGLGWLTFSATYQLRKPLRDEVFFDKAKPNTGASDQLRLTEHLRHYVELSPIVKIGSGYFSLKPTFKRGSLPPAFNHVDNELSISIQVAARAKRQ